MKPNQEIRKLIRDSNIYNWQVCKKLSIGDNTFYRMLRRELTDEEKQKIVAAVEQIKEENLKIEAI